MTKPMLPFNKYEGAGNDFILIDLRAGGQVPDRATIAALCDRRRGIGADGLMALERQQGLDFRMRYFNADGGESTMCGNGGRCIALYAHHLGIGQGSLRFQAPDGEHRADILSETGPEARVALSMSDVERIESLSEGASFLNTGSPHYVAFVNGLEALDVRTEGARLRHDERFAAGGGTNVNFVELVSDGHIRVRTFERGVEDETLACGTGAVASALATWQRTGSSLWNWKVEVAGGLLEVQFIPREGGSFGQIILTGAARKVFDGTYVL